MSSTTARYSCACGPSHSAASACRRCISTYVCRLIWTSPARTLCWETPWAPAPLGACTRVRLHAKPHCQDHNLWHSPMQIMPCQPADSQHSCAGTFKGEQVAVKVLHAAHLGKGSPTHKAFEQEVAVLSRQVTCSLLPASRQRAAGGPAMAQPVLHTWTLLSDGPCKRPCTVTDARMCAACSTPTSSTCAEPAQLGPTSASWQSWLPGDPCMTCCTLLASRHVQSPMPRCAGSMRAAGVISSRVPGCLTHEGTCSHASA